MDSLLIHLSGSLSAEMGSELYLKIKEQSQSPTLFCLDCSLLVSADEVGAMYFHKIAKRLGETASKLALTGLPSALNQEFQKQNILDLFPQFTNAKDAKLFLESQGIPSVPANESNTEPKLEIKNPTSRKDDILVSCPACSQKLKVQKIGDHSCPNCKNKFSVNQRGWTTLYERLL
ncbi:MAG: STAS domain-containing protein [Leptospira sp.]|nr:STAS domain-containing protein [Leptospira sp.]